MINTLRSEYDHLLASLFLTKKEDPGVPTIECTIGQRIFHNTFCDIGLGVNIMSKVMYDYLFGDEPLFPTYMQLQMADQSTRFPEGIGKDIMVKIQDHYVPTEFMILDMGEEEVPVILGRPFLNTTNVIIYIGSGQIDFQFSRQKVCCYFNSYITYEQPKKTCFKRRRRSSQHQRNQSPKNEDEDEEVVENESTTLKSNSQTKQVWKEKVTSSPKSPSQEMQPSRSPSLGPTGAPKE